MTEKQVQGITVDSENEYNVAVALSYFKLPFQYQVPFAGGTLVRGGQVIDFVVDKPPMQIPVFVGSEGYYHSGRMGLEDSLKMAEIEASGYYDQPVEITEEESRTVEAAKAAVRNKIGVM